MQILVCQTRNGILIPNRVVFVTHKKSEDNTDNRTERERKHELTLPQ